MGITADNKNAFTRSAESPSCFVPIQIRLSRLAVCFAAALSFLAVPILSLAQAIPPSEQPGRERERFIEPTPPRAKPAAPAITLPSTVAPEGAEKVQFVLRQLDIVGSSVYSTDDFRPLYQELIGREVSLLTIYQIAQRITARYGNDGYVLSRAIVPPQQLDPKDAVVRIEIIEGFIDKVVWPTDVLSRYRDFFTSYATKITSVRPANIYRIERYLLLAGDLPGLKFSTNLRASPDTPAASTLVVEVAEKRFDANLRLDNRGTRARGPYQLVTTASANNLFGNHEAIGLTYATVFPPDELQYVAGTYRQVLTSEGLSGFVNASHSWGNPGTVDLEVLEFGTKSTFVETGLSYPIIRARERNLSVTGLYFASDSESDILGVRLNNDRMRGLRFRLEADGIDRWRAINQATITFSQGVKGAGATSNDNALASRPFGRVDFTKFEAYLSRTQPLPADFSVALAAYGQYAFTSLLAPEQCGYGGRTFGRAYDPAAILADHCWQLLGELRYDVRTALLPIAQIYGFGDYGRLYTVTPLAGVPSDASAASAGAGLRIGSQVSLVDLTAAKAIHGPRNGWRFFAALSLHY